MKDGAGGEVEDDSLVASPPSSPPAPSAFDDTSEYDSDRALSKAAIAGRVKPF